MSNAPGFREFLHDPQAPSSDHTWHDTCGEFALDFGEAMSKGIKATPEEMLLLTHDMVAHGEHKHGTTLAGLADEAKRRGLVPELFENKTSDEYHQKLLECAGVRPVVILFQLAQNLVDCETGIGYSFRKPWVQDLKNHALHGHYVCVINKQTDGYICADGANPQSLTRYSVYRWDTLVKSDIVGFLILPAPKSATPPTTKDTHVTTPTPPPPTPAPAPAPKPQVDSELVAMLTDLSNLLAPFVNVNNQLVALRKKLGV